MIKLTTLANIDYWVDKATNNRWSTERFTKEQAIEAAASMKNSTNCEDCTSCTNCKLCLNCTECEDCVTCSNCTNCTSCVVCTHCYYCTYSYACSSCMNCKECDSLIGCTHCTSCKDSLLISEATDCNEYILPNYFGVASIDYIKQILSDIEAVNMLPKGGREGLLIDIIMKASGLLQDKKELIEEACQVEGVYERLYPQVDYPQVDEE